MKLRLSNHLLVFGLICLAPVVLAVLVLGYDRALEERRRVEEQTVTLVKDFQGDIDVAVANLTNVLQALATSPSIESKDWTTFHRQSEIVAREVDAVIVLRDLDGRHLVNTLFADRPPQDLMTIDPKLKRADAKAIETGRPVLSDLYTGATKGTPYLAVVVPLIRDGHAAMLLTAAITTERITSKLVLGKLADKGWLAAVIGSDLRLVARTRDPKTYVGTMASPEMARVLSSAPSGILQSRTLDGVDVFTAFQRTDLGWWVVVSVPLVVLHEPVRALVILMLSIASAVLAATLIAAWTYGRVLGREVSTLSRNARAMGQDAPLQPYSQHIIEVAEAQQALFDAQSKVDALIAELNHRVKNTLTVIKVLASRSVGSRRDRDAVSSRISALTIAHEALTETRWRGADLGRLAQTIARSCDAAIACTGPAVRLEPKAAVALAQIVQELLSNARQHGALRERSGRIDLTWSVTDGMLQITWAERSPLRPQGPDHAAGFGLQVVELCVVRQLGGEVNIHAKPEGWTVDMAIPMRGDLGAMAELTTL